jgi:hypothetical protein
MVKVNIEVTNSKIIGYLMLFMAFIMDLLNDKGGVVFMFTVPFVAFMITGKQYFDKNKPEA